jgi:hypothetical protein
LAGNHYKHFKKLHKSYQLDKGFQLVYELSYLVEGKFLSISTRWADPFKKKYENFPSTRYDNSLDTLLGCWGPFLIQNNEKKNLRKMKKVKKSSQSQSHDFDFFGNLKKVKVMTLT